MKTKVLILLAAMCVLTTGCRRFVDDIMDLVTYPTTPENVAQRAKRLGSDAALVTSVGDTQYVLYRFSAFIPKADNQIGKCYAMRYAKTDTCSGWNARTGEFRLNEPTVPVRLTWTDSNALTLWIDSISIAVADIEGGDSAYTFRFGFDEPDREATLYLFDRRAEEPFGKTTIQQMLSLALSLDVLMAEWDSDLDTAFVEADEALEDAERELEEAMAQPSALSWAERYAEYSRMDSVAGALGFREKSATADDDRIKLVVTGGFGRQKKCYDRMERMGKAASESRCRVWTVDHSLGHRNCKFTIEWW